MRKIARELTEKLRASNSVDWYVRESVRAKLRLMVKTILKKYKYPPDGQERATETVWSSMLQMPSCCQRDRSCIASRSSKVHP